MKTSPRALQLVSALNVVFSYIPATILLNSGKSVIKAHFCTVTRKSEYKMVNGIMKKIADFIDMWRAGAITGQLVITVDFTQGSAKHIDICEKARLNLK
jgi:hypothetical protein